MPDDTVREWIYDSFGYPYRDYVRIIGYVEPNGHTYPSELYFDVAQCIVTTRQVQVERIILADAGKRGLRGVELQQFLGQALAVEMHVHDPRWNWAMTKDNRPTKYIDRQS